MQHHTRVSGAVALSDPNGAKFNRKFQGGSEAHPAGSQCELSGRASEVLLEPCQLPPPLGSHFGIRRLLALFEAHVD